MCTCVHVFLQSPATRHFYAATAEFNGIEDEPGHLSIAIGDTVEVIQLAHGGWWKVRKVGTDEVGWVPASFLAEITNKSLMPVLETSI